jgi:hypothetical protein
LDKEVVAQAVAVELQVVLVYSLPGVARVVPEVPMVQIVIPLVVIV